MSNTHLQDQTTQTNTDMKMFVDIQKICLYREPVDFRKAIDRLALIVEQEINISAFERAVFVFCNKRLEKHTFKWPRHHPDKTLFLCEYSGNLYCQGFPSAVTILLSSPQLLKYFGW